MFKREEEQVRKEKWQLFYETALWKAECAWMQFVHEEDIRREFIDETDKQPENSREPLHSDMFGSQFARMFTEEEEIELAF